MAIIKLVKNDTRPSLRFTCKDDDDNIIDLSTATKIYFIFKKFGEDEEKFKKECTIISPTEGIIQYSWEEDDLDESGQFEGEIEIDFSDGTKQTCVDKILFNIRNDLDNN